MDTSSWVNLAASTVGSAFDSFMAYKTAQLGAGSGNSSTYRSPTITAGSGAGSAAGIGLGSTGVLLLGGVVLLMLLKK